MLRNDSYAFFFLLLLVKNFVFDYLMLLFGSSGSFSSFSCVLKEFHFLLDSLQLL